MVLSKIYKYEKAARILRLKEQTLIIYSSTGKVKAKGSYGLKWIVEEELLRLLEKRLDFVSRGIRYQSTPQKRRLLWCLRKNYERITGYPWESNLEELVERGPRRKNTKCFREYTVPFSEIKRELIKEYYDLRDPLRFFQIALFCEKRKTDYITIKKDAYFKPADVENIKKSIKEDIENDGGMPEEKKITIKNPCTGRPITVVFDIEKEPSKKELETIAREETGGLKK